MLQISSRNITKMVPFCCATNISFGLPPDATIEQAKTNLDNHLEVQKIGIS